MTVADIHDHTQTIDSWTPQNLNHLPEHPPVPPQLGQTNLVYPGKRHVFSGPPESAKTLAAYCILIQTVRTGGTCILIDFEMGGYDARQRLRELGATPLEISQIAYIEPDEPATKPRITRLVALEPNLVVIDATAGVYSLEGLDDNKRGDVEKISGLYVRAFWQHNIATILIDHVVKDTETRGRYAIGSERKLGGADVHLGFDTITPISRGTTGRYKITTHKDRGGYLKRGHLADLHLNSNPETHAINWSFTEAVTTTDDQGQFRRTGYMERASIKLELADEPISIRELKRRVKGTGTYVDDAVETLVHEGYVELSSGPHNAKLLSSKRQYREADDALLKPQNTSSDSVIRQWFGSDSANQSSSSDSVIRGAYAPESDEALTTPKQTTPKPASDSAGWFNSNGHLQDTDLATWQDQIAPDPNDDIPF